MTTYTPITNAEIDQDSPITQPLLTALRDNPVAITEGAAGAPKIQAAALSTFVATAPATITGLNNFAAINIRGGGEHGVSGVSGELTLAIELSDDGGSTWATSSTIMTTSVDADNTISVFLDISVNLLTGAFYTSGSKAGTVGAGGFDIISRSDTVNMPSGAVDAVRITASTGSFALNIYGG